jgi:hypothetical protein
MSRFIRSDCLKIERWLSFKWIWIGFSWQYVFEVSERAWLFRFFSVVSLDCRRGWDTGRWYCRDDIYDDSGIAASLYELEWFFLETKMICESSILRKIRHRYQSFKPCGSVGFTKMNIWQFNYPGECHVYSVIEISANFLTLFDSWSRKQLRRTVVSSDPIHWSSSQQLFVSDYPFDRFANHWSICEMIAVIT